MKKPSVFSFALLPILLYQCGVVAPSFDVDIRREFSSAFEESLIAQAEGLYPPREDVVAVFEGSPIPDGLLWAYTASEPYLPYAITAEAIAYYEAQVLAAESDYEENGYRGENSVFTDYLAAVSFEASYPINDEIYEQVYVVRMELRHGHSCGPLCGSGFNAERTVIFDETGAILAVYGDGQARRWLAKGDV